MGDIILVRPTDLYEEQVMSYREEMLKNGDSFDGCAGLENVQSFSEWIDFEVIYEFRKKGFWAGHVSESGIWKIQDWFIDSKCASIEKLYGEIDALAYMQELNMAILVECKVLNDIIFTCYEKFFSA